MNAKKVGSFIKEQRQELGLSQKELAEKLYILPTRQSASGKRGEACPIYHRSSRLAMP